MTVADNTSRNQYTATSGQTVFAYTFEIVDKDDIVVLKNGTTLSEGTDYTVSNVGNDSGGNITLTVGASTNDVLTLYRDMPYARTQNYTNSGDFLASEVNSDFDNLWLAGEQTNRAFEQSVRKPITDSDSISMELPEASSRANKLLGFDATGAVSTSLVTDDAETIAGIAADIETLAHIQDGTVATDAITNVNTIRTDVTAVSGVASDVTAVAGNTANINTVASDLTGADDIGTVAGSISNVDTVAGDIANVNSVAGNSTNINTVAADLSGADDIGTVAGSISSVNTVAPDINHVVTVSGDLAGADNIGTVATNISNVNAVGGISSDVTTVAGISTEVTAVSSNSANVNTVGTNITNVNDVGSNIANVNTVAGLETEINAVVADAADIGVVGANITSVNTVSSNIASVNAVYNNMSDVNNAAANATAAAASAADANTSAGAAATSANAASTSASNASSSESAALTSANNASQSAATASLSASAAATSATNASSSAANAATSESNADNSETAAAISASNASSSASTASNNAIAAASSATSASNSASQAASSASAAATSATNSETAADTWNSYYSTYLGASATAPSYDLLGQPLQNGALYFNTTDDTMYVFNGSIWIAAESTINIVSVPTQLAADLTTNGNDIIFGDNDKAKFGAGSDLEIYSDGTTGKLIGDIDVTGTVTADGLDVNSGASNNVASFISTDYQAHISFSDSSTTTAPRIGAQGDDLIAIRSGTEYLYRSYSNGNFSLFENTGTTPKFHWDASAESLILGGTSPVNLGDTTGNGVEVSETGINIKRTCTASTQGLLHLNNIGTTGNVVEFYIDGTQTGALGVASGAALTFNSGAGSSERMRIDSSGKVGIGTGSPGSALTVSGSIPNAPTGDGVHLGLASNYAQMQLNGSAGGIIDFSTSGTDHIGRILYDQTSDYMRFDTNYVERMRIDSSGNVGIGTDSPATELHVYNGSSNADIRAQGGGASDYISLFHGASQSGLWSTSSADPMVFATNNAERMRIQSGGGVGIGVTSFSTKLEVNGNIGIGRTAGGYTFRETAGGGERASIKSDAGNSLIFNYGAITEGARLTGTGDFLVGTTDTNVSDNTTGGGININGDGEIKAAKNGTVLNLNRLTTDGEIIRFKKGGTTTVGSIGTFSGEVYIANDGTIDAGLRFRGDSGRVVPCTATGGLSDDAVDLGYTNARFDDIYATNGTIQTSDRNDKQDIAELSDAEQRVAVAAKGLLRKFRWKSSVADKGDEARIHFGIIAQDLQAAFEAEGLDAERYAMFISTTWTDEETGEERSRMGVRYSELLAFIIAAI